MLWIAAVAETAMVQVAKQVTAEIEVFAAIPFWVFHPDHGAPELARAAIAELSELSGSVILDMGNGRSCPVRIETFSKSSKFKYLADRTRQSPSAVAQSFLRLSSRVGYSSADLDGIQYSGSRKLRMGERARLFLDVTCSELHSILVDLYLASIIAIPGSFYFFGSWMFADRKSIRDVGDATTSLADARRRATELGWPPIQQLKVRDVYKWLRGVPGFSERRGIDRLGRALAALSYLVRSKPGEQDELSLVWALIGLEALYCVGNVGLKSQLLEKSEAFLGSRQQNKKRFGWMYDFRSRLIHGDLDLRYQHNDHDAGPEFEQFWDQIHECEDLRYRSLTGNIAEAMS